MSDECQRYGNSLGNSSGCGVSSKLNAHVVCAHARRFIIYNLGGYYGWVCRDTHRSGFLWGRYERAQTVDDADVALLVTCAIRDNAEKKILHRLHHLGEVVL